MSIDDTAGELRDLAEIIHSATHEHPAYPIAADIIRNAVNHIRAEAMLRAYRQTALTLALRERAEGAQEPR